MKRGRAGHGGARSGSARLGPAGPGEARATMNATELENRYQAALAALAEILWSDVVELESVPSVEIVTDSDANEEISA